MRRIVRAYRTLGKLIVLTSGTFDLVHIGHARYLKYGRGLGDVLIVGIDSDDKVRRRKGPHRPVVPQEERVEILLHLPYVDHVFLKEDSHPHWRLIETVRPDVLLATEETYTKAELKRLKKFCKKVVVLEPQATTTTTARLRLLLVRPTEEVLKRLVSSREGMNGIFAELESFIRQIGGKK
ncbi:D-glycero-beta-D-manno-heptose 1-phosphate adenylyltransferase [Candidatus Parcubacteria bacterium]|nr:MAG: D-glycero-beta-D-manno-heptose 1-phosphate adenylyltransferase [Candidatus Parcubacteria bacterium]